MNRYSSKDLAATFKQFHLYLKDKIDEFDRVGSLPEIRTRSALKAEIAARKKAVAILKPIEAQFEVAAAQYAREAYEDQMPKELKDYPADPLEFGGYEWDE